MNPIMYHWALSFRRYPMTVNPVLIFFSFKLHARDDDVTR